MNNIKINKTKLLEIVRKNRIKHEEEYAEAVKGYREKLIKKLRSLLKAANAGDKVPLVVGLVEPTSNLDDYDCAIRMLELSEDTIVELDLNGFEELVLDKWSWKDSFSSTNALYSGQARARR